MLLAFGEIGNENRLVQIEKNPTGTINEIHTLVSNVMVVVGTSPFGLVFSTNVEIKRAKSNDHHHHPGL